MSIDFTVQISSRGTGTGVARIYGLPFPGNSTATTMSGVIMPFVNNLATSVVRIQGRIYTSESTILVTGMASASTGDSELDFPTYFGTNSIIYGSSTYCT